MKSPNLSAFRYGSKVFAQSSHSTKTSLTDYILIPSNALSYHKFNLKVNPDHYSALFRVFGANFAYKFHKCGVNHVYFNTNVQSRHAGRIKYGIVEREDVLRDLLQWSELYVAGRMHKPVEWRYLGGQDRETSSMENAFLDVDGIEAQWAATHHNEQLKASVDSQAQDTSQQPSPSWNDHITTDPELLAALQINRTRALLFAVLFCLPPTTSTIRAQHSLQWDQLYEHICRLSYDGDVRMRLRAESAHKIRNIVEGQKPYFNAIYRDNIVAHKLSHSQTDGSESLNVYWTEWAAHLRHTGVPQHVTEVQRKLQPSNEHLHLENALQQSEQTFVQNFSQVQQLTKQAMEKIVFDSSKSQLVKGFFTAGATTSIRYAWHKIVKSLQSRR